MSIKQIENDIVAKLKENFGELLVEGFPEKPNEFTLIHPIGAILVHYRGGVFGVTNAINFLNQEKKMEFAITIVTRNLRSNNGAYEILEKVKQVLCGFRANSCSKLTPTKEGFLSEINGIWQYEIVFSLTAPSVEFAENYLNFEILEEV